MVTWSVVRQKSSWRIAVLAAFWCALMYRAGISAFPLCESKLEYSIVICTVGKFYFLKHSELMSCTIKRGFSDMPVCDAVQRKPSSRKCVRVSWTNHNRCKRVLPLGMCTEVVLVSTNLGQKSTELWGGFCWHSDTKVKKQKWKMCKFCMNTSIICKIDTKSQKFLI